MNCESCGYRRRFREFRRQPYLCGVKRALVYILFSSAFLNYTSLSQLLKLPVLFVHFQEHKEIDSRISFLNFLSMHYFGEDMNDDDDEQDMKLPYKSVDSKSLHHAVSPVPRFFHHKVAFTYYRQPVYHYESDHLSQRALDSLFRPPRV